MSRSLGDQLRYAREVAELTQLSVATRAGIAVSTLQRIETGEANPKLATLEAVAEALGQKLVIKLREW